MRPSNYNYLKRMWTREMSKNSGCLTDIVLFPFKIVWYIFLFELLIAFFTIKWVCYILLFVLKHFGKFICWFTKTLVEYFKYFFSLVLNSKPTSLKNEDSDPHILLEKAKHYADIVNNTTDFKEFVFSYKMMIDNLKLLVVYEKDGYFKESNPSVNLERITKQRNATEKDFIDRFVKKNGIGALQDNRHYLNNFTLETVNYVAAMINRNYPLDL